MAISEIFPRPTVNSVFFEIRFPNLLFLEGKMGEFQLQVIERFPESELLYRRQIVFADIAPGAVPQDVQPSHDDLTARKAWKFSAPDDYSFILETNLLVVSSQHHKSYNLGDGDRFRDVIQYVVDAFLDITRIPLIQRIGLRYVDKCPLPSMDNDTLARYYNTTFPLQRFNIDDADEMRFQTVVRQGDVRLRYVEELKLEPGNGQSLILDFDAFRGKVQASNYLTATDELHELISAAYEATIQQPVYDYMRTREE